MELTTWANALARDLVAGRGRMQDVLALRDRVSGACLPANLPWVPLVVRLPARRRAGQRPFRRHRPGAVTPAACRRSGGDQPVPVLALLPAIHLLAYGLLRWTGQPVFDPRPTVTVVLVSFAVCFVGALCEEVGSTAYATGEPEISTCAPRRVP